MWEEDQRHQNCTFKFTLWLAGAGTLILGILCFLSGQKELFVKWISGLFLFVGAWLVVAGIIYGVVRLWRAKSKNAAE